MGSIRFFGDLMDGHGVPCAIVLDMVTTLKEASGARGARPGRARRLLVVTCALETGPRITRISP
jgi:hypothetical protein